MKQKEKTCSRGWPPTDANAACNTITEYIYARTADHSFNTHATVILDNLRQRYSYMASERRVWAKVCTAVLSAKVAIMANIRPNERPGS